MITDDEEILDVRRRSTRAAAIVGRAVLRRVPRDVRLIVLATTSAILVAAVLAWSPQQPRITFVSVACDPKQGVDELVVNVLSAAASGDKASLLGCVTADMCFAGSVRGCNEAIAGFSSSLATRGVATGGASDIKIAAHAPAVDGARAHRLMGVLTCVVWRIDADPDWPSSEARWLMFREVPSSRWLLYEIQRPRGGGACPMPRATDQN